MFYLDAVYQHDLGINDRQADVAESVLQQGVGPGPMGPLARSPHKCPLPRSPSRQSCSNHHAVSARTSVLNAVVPVNFHEGLTQAGRISALMLCK